jgi:purine-binding chemotaxis protein CheW
VDLAKIRKKARKKESGTKEIIKRKISEAETPEPVEEKTAPVDNPVPVIEEKPRADVEVPSAYAGPEIPAKIDTPPQPQTETPLKDNDKKLEKLLVFKVGRNRYAIPIEDLSQIIDDRILTPLPHVPQFLKGIFSLRGHIVGVLDVSERLCLPPLPAALLKKIIVLEKGGDLFGLRVENIEHVVEVDISSLEAPPDSFDSIQQEFVLGVFHYKQKTVAFLNLQLFLDFNVAGRS